MKINLNEHIIQYEHKYKVNVLKDLNTYGSVVLKLMRNHAENILTATQSNVPVGDYLIFSDSFDNSYKVFVSDVDFIMYQIEYVED